MTMDVAATIDPEIAAALASFSGVGVSHLQLVLDPITAESIEALAPVLEILDRG